MKKTRTVTPSTTGTPAGAGARRMRTESSTVLLLAPQAPASAKPDVLQVVVAERVDEEPCTLLEYAYAVGRVVQEAHERVVRGLRLELRVEPGAAWPERLRSRLVRQLDHVRVVVVGVERLAPPGRVDREGDELVRVGDVHRPVAEAELVLLLLDPLNSVLGSSCLKRDVDAELLQLLLEDLAVRLLDLRAGADEQRHLEALRVLRLRHLGLRLRDVVLQARASSGRRTAPAAAGTSSPACRGRRAPT